MTFRLRYSVNPLPMSWVQGSVWGKISTWALWGRRESTSLWFLQAWVPHWPGLDQKNLTYVIATL